MGIEEKIYDVRAQWWYAAALAGTKYVLAVVLAVLMAWAFVQPFIK